MKLAVYTTVSANSTACHVTPVGSSTALCGRKVLLRVTGWIGDEEPSTAAAERINRTVMSACAGCHRHLPEFERVIRSAAANYDPTRSKR